ncbi:MAG: hypothetical protein K1W15_11540 [Lachnospiraceae bacterium]
MKEYRERTGDSGNAAYQDEELIHINRLALIVVSVISVFLFGGYLKDAADGNITWGFAVLVASISAFIFIVNNIIYFINKKSNVLKNSIVIECAVLYLVAMLGAKNDLVFIIAVPLTGVIMLYFDLKFMVSTSIGVFLINIIYVCFRLYKGTMPSGLPISLSTILLQVAGMAVYLVAMCQATLISNKINVRKLKQIAGQKEQSEKLLSDVLGIATVIRENSVSASEKISSLRDATLKTSDSLEEISKGNSLNAESIEKQTLMTGNIQEKIINTKNISDEMVKNAQNSLEAVKEGQQSMKELLLQAEFIEQSNHQAAGLMQILSENAKKVGSITEEIFSISSQTNMLALNASIESARAGEAGRGFAVVAEQIRVLAEQTRKLTENIRSIVGELEENTNETLGSVSKMLDASAEEKKNIGIAGENFSNIHTVVTMLGDNVKVIGNSIDDIYSANNQIVDSISQISAVSEEVAANTLEAGSIGKTSSEEAGQAAEFMEKLLDVAQKLDGYL